MDWDACTSYDWEALDAANERYQYVWQTLGDIVNATDYSGDWSSSYNMSSNWSSSYNGTFNATAVEMFNEEVQNVWSFQKLEFIFNQTAELEALPMSANLTAFEEGMKWYKPGKWAY